MIAYFVIFALCGIIVLQSVVYYRERLKLYKLIGDDSPLSLRRHPPSQVCEGGKGEETKETGNVGRDDSGAPLSRGHKRAMKRWRNGGNVLNIEQNGGDEV